MFRERTKKVFVFGRAPAGKINGRQTDFKENRRRDDDNCVPYTKHDGQWTGYTRRRRLSIILVQSPQTRSNRRRCGRVCVCGGGGDFRDEQKAAAYLRTFLRSGIRGDIRRSPDEVFTAPIL